MKNMKCLLILLLVASLASVMKAVPTPDVASLEDVGTDQGTNGEISLPVAPQETPESGFKADHSDEREIPDLSTLEVGKSDVSTSAEKPTFTETDNLGTEGGLKRAVEAHQDEHMNVVEVIREDESNEVTDKRVENHGGDVVPFVLDSDVNYCLRRAAKRFPPIGNPDELTEDEQRAIARALKLTSCTRLLVRSSIGRGDIFSLFPTLFPPLFSLPTISPAVPTLPSKPTFFPLNLWLENFTLPTVIPTLSTKPTLFPGFTLFPTAAPNSGTIPPFGKQRVPPPAVTDIRQTSPSSTGTGPAPSKFSLLSSPIRVGNFTLPSLFPNASVLADKWSQIFANNTPPAVGAQDIRQGSPSTTTKAPLFGNFSLSSLFPSKPSLFPSLPWPFNFTSPADYHQYLAYNNLMASAAQAAAQAAADRNFGLLQASPSSTTAAPGLFGVPCLPCPAGQATDLKSLLAAIGECAAQNALTCCACVFKATVKAIFSGAVPIQPPPHHSSEELTPWISCFSKSDDARIENK